MLVLRHCVSIKEKQMFCVRVYYRVYSLEPDTQHMLRFHIQLKETSECVTSASKQTPMTSDQ